MTVHTDNTMMEQIGVKNAATNVKLVLMKIPVQYVQDHTEILHQIVTVLQDIMKTQLI